MKRFLLFLSFALILVGLGISDYSLLNLKDRYPQMQVVFYTKDSRNLDSINDGIYNQVYCSTDQAKKIKRLLNKIEGMSVSFEGGIQDLNFVIDYFDVKIISEKTCDDILYIYGYSSLILTPAVKINNNYINIQLVLRKDKIIIGTPIILGSY
ncbi:MAG TPA: hypothetical protein VIL26_02780 [Clostridia bacterium]